VRIGAAAAEIAGHVFADLVIRAGVTLANAGDRRHDLAGRAVAALEGVLFEEGGLHGMQRAIRPGKPLHGGDGAAVSLSGKRQAGQHALAVDMHGAGAALALVATLLGAGQVETITQGVEQRHTRLDLKVVVMSVDVEMDGDCCFRHGRLAPFA
jgi:hypothetical protein